MKILIIGHPGAGKTYLADKLSAELGVEKIDIDVLFDKHPFYLFSKTLYGQQVRKLVGKKENWIIDGYHVKLMPNHLWEQADYVLYLNPPKDTLKENIVARQKIKKANKEFSHWQATGANNIKNFAQIRFQDKALKADIKRIKSLMHHEAKFLELKTKDEITNFSLS